MLPYRDTRITRAVLAVFFVIVCGYAYYEVRGVLYGPRLSVPSETMVVHEEYIALKGQADRIATLKMNGKPITVTEDGSFEEPYLLAVGLNRIVLDAVDKYGNTRQKVVQIVYSPEASPVVVPSTEEATTTPVAP